MRLHVVCVLYLSSSYNFYWNYGTIRLTIRLTNLNPAAIQFILTTSVHDHHSNLRKSLEPVDTPCNMIQVLLPLLIFDYDFHIVLLVLVKSVLKLNHNDKKFFVLFFLGITPCTITLRVAISRYIYTYYMCYV